jgi:TonB family protein
MILTPIFVADAPTCTTPNHGVVMVKAAELRYPDSARNLGLGPVKILVQIAINPDGSVKSAKIVQSTYNLALDEAALQAAARSVYSPMIVNCEAQYANAMLVIDMDPSDQDLITVEPMPNAPSCTTPNRDVTVVNAVAPDLNGLETHVTGPTSVTVRVSIEPSGRVSGVDVVNSSGDRLLDDAVIRAARASTYAPRYVDCKAVAGEYTFLTNLQ